MVDFAATQVRAKGVFPSANHKGGQAEAAAATPSNALPRPNIDEVDRLYH
jgi:hypothetical protein